MDWTYLLKEALNYIENHLDGELSIPDIARHIHLSPFYFQRAFSIVCGMSVMEYVKNRRLARAGLELMTTQDKIIDIALRYGYDSASSFSRAFTRFHGFTPTQIRAGQGVLRSFHAFEVQIVLKGGHSVDYRIEQKPEMELITISREFPYDKADEVTGFWKEVTMDPAIPVMGMLGISHDQNMEGQTFVYSIADPYTEEKKTDQTEKMAIPAYTWAVFPMKGFSPEKYYELNQKIFNQWLPNNPYKVTAGYNIEYYSNPADYPLGMMDPDYISEIWIPVEQTEEQ